jgi:hypothetical protein
MSEKAGGVPWEGQGAATAKRDRPLSKALVGAAEITLKATLR